MEVNVVFGWVSLYSSNWLDSFQGNLDAQLVCSGLIWSDRLGQVRHARASEWRVVNS